MSFYGGNAMMGMGFPESKPVISKKVWINGDLFLMGNKYTP